MMSTMIPILLIAAAIMVVLTHQKNIVRLVSGNENKAKLLTAMGKLKEAQLRPPTQVSISPWHQETSSRTHLVLQFH